MPNFDDSPKKKQISNKFLDGCVNKYIADHTYNITLTDGTKEVEFILRDDMSDGLRQIYMNEVYNRGYDEDEYGLRRLNSLMVTSLTHVFILDRLSSFPVPTNDDVADAYKCLIYGKYLYDTVPEYAEVFDKIYTRAVGLLEDDIEQHNALIIAKGHALDVYDILGALGEFVKSGALSLDKTTGELS